MEISKLNELRNKMHKQFVNRQPVNDETVTFTYGVGENGIDAFKAQMLKKLVELVAEKSDNALVMPSTEFEGSVKVKCAKCEKTFTAENEAALSGIVTEVLG